MNRDRKSSTASAPREGDKAPDLKLPTDGGGMLAATAVGILVVPLLFLIFEWIGERFSRGPHPAKRPAAPLTE